MEIEDEQVFYVWEPMAAKDEPELKQILRRAGEEQKAVLMFPSQELASMEGRTLHGDQDRLEAQIMDYIQGNNGKVHQCEVLKNLPYLETKVCLIRLYFKGVLDYNWQESAFEIVVTLFPVKNCLTEGQELDIIADSGD